MQIPIACSLDAESARRQVGEWQDLLGSAAAGVERMSPREVAIRLVDDVELVTATVSLARREKACCPFFDFTLRIEADGLRLHIGVPEDAVSLLDRLLTEQVPRVGGDDEEHPGGPNQ